MNAPRIRKQVYHLSVADFQQFPVWEFALDEEGEEGQDEATVRPYRVEGNLNPAEGMFVVRARFVLADGTAMQGYLTPSVQGDTGLGSVQPTILTAQGQVAFWCGIMAPDPATVSTSYARLGKSSAAQVFPLRFEADVPLAGVAVQGELQGFLVLEDFKTKRVRVVT